MNFCKHENSDSSPDTDIKKDFGGDRNPDSPLISIKKGSSEEQLLCEYCDRVYASKTTLSRHLLIMHKIPAKKIPPDYLLHEFAGAVCYEEGCDNQKFKSATELRNHLADKHNFVFQVIKNELRSERDFVIWKKNTEDACKIRWVKQATKRKASGCTVVTYICNRSGKFRKTGLKRRNMKSCKTGHCCTAYLKVVITGNKEEEKTFQVELYPDHYGHEVSLPGDKKKFYKANVWRTFVGATDSAGATYSFDEIDSTEDKMTSCTTECPPKKTGHKKQCPDPVQMVKIVE